MPTATGADGRRRIDEDGGRRLAAAAVTRSRKNKMGLGLDGGVAAPGGKASRDGAAADEGGGAGSRNLKL